MKKGLTFVCVIALLLTMVAVGGFSMASAETSGDWKYEIKGGKAVITKYTGSAYTLTIPSTLGGYSVSEIGWCAFEGNYYIENITIPSSVKTIGKAAFNNCDYLETVKFGSGVTAIGEVAFADCYRLKSVSIPSNVKTIGVGAFSDCDQLTSISLPDGLTEIGQEAFDNTAYYYDYTNWDGLVLYIGNHLIEANEYIYDTYTVRTGTKTIAANAFRNRDDLTGIVIPSSVQYIGDYAFCDCDYLESISVTDSVKMIGEGAFSNTEYYYEYSHWDGDKLYLGNHLLEVDRNSTAASQTVRAGTKTIAKSAFQYCQMTSVTIPSSVTAIGKHVFIGCSALNSINVNSGNSAYSSAGNCLIEKSTKTLLAGCKSSTIPSDGSVTSIGTGAFAYNHSLKTINIPVTVTSIGLGAFYDCTALNKVNYGGDQNDWKKVMVENGNKDLTTAPFNYTTYATVSYHANGGGGAPASQKKYPGTPLKLSTTIPVRAGYAFVGWGTSASATTASYQPGGQFKNNTNTTLYAVWQKGAYRISFSGNGGSGVPNAQIKVPGTALKLSTTVPTRSGYAFVGWSTSASATTASYQPGGQFKNNTHTTLYAVWQKGAYRISFSGNGGSGVPNAQIKVPGTALKLSTTVPTRSGYAFVGWSTSPSATTASYQPGSSFKNNTHTTLYAVWQKGAYRISFSGNGGSGVPNAQIKVPGTALKLSTTVPTRSGYAFVGWSTSASSTTASYQPGSSFKNNAHTTLYAVWQKGAYRISFSGNGGSGVPNAQIKIPGTALKLSTTVPKRDGYAFVGWSTSASATTASYQPGGQFKNNTTTTLYAVWQKGAYRISFNGNGGSGVPNAQIKVPGTALTLSSTMPKRDGYAFLGWSTDKNATTATYQPEGQFKNNSHTTLYAIWKKGVYRVSYNANGGSGAPGPQFKVPGTPLTLSTTRPKRSGYQFLGWATDKNANAGTYASGAQFKNNTNTTLYAIWKKSASTLTMGSTHTANITTGGQEVRFTFKPTASGTYRIYATSTGDTQVYLYDASGNQLAYDDDSGDGLSFLLEYTLTAGVTYQYGVRYYSSSNTGAITFRFEKAAHSDLTPGNSYTANITTGGGQAEYTFIPSTSGTYRIYSTGSGDTRVYLYDAAGTQLDGDDDSGDSYNFSLDYTMTAGTTYKYVIRFYGSSSTGSIPFHLQKI